MSITSKTDAPPAYQSQTTLIGDVNNTEDHEDFVQLNFSNDNPCNTSIYDASGTARAMYTVQTTGEPSDLTVLNKIVRKGDMESNEEIFSLKWRDTLSDKISIRGAKSVPFVDVLSASSIFSWSRKFKYDGKTYRWSRVYSTDGSELFVENAKTPIAYFQKSRPPLAPHVQPRDHGDRSARPASLFVSPEVSTVPGLLDMILITFLPMEKSLRFQSTASLNQVQGMTVSGVSVGQDTMNWSPLR